MMRTVKKGVLLAAALVIAIAAGVFVSNKNTCVYAEEAGFNTGQFGAVCQVYGDGYDKSYFKKGETPSPKLMYWWTRVSHDLLLTDAEYSFDEFADLVSENFALETDWETDLEQFFTDNSDSGEDFVYEDGVLKLQATGAGGGGTYNLEEYQSDVTEGTGRIRCLWAEDESWGKYVAEECVILLENGAITQFVPVNFMASGKEYAAAEGKSITLEAPVVYTPRGRKVNTDNYLIKWYQAVPNQDGYDLVNLHKDEEYDFGDRYESIKVPAERESFYVCEFWEQNTYTGERTRVPDIEAVPYGETEQDYWIKVNNTSYQEDQSAPEIGYLKMSYEPLAVGAKLSDLQVTGEARYDVTPIRFGQDNRTYSPDTVYKKQNDSMTVVLRVVPKDGFTVQADPQPAGFIGDQKLIYYGDTSKYTHDPEKDQYPNAHYFAFQGLKIEYLYTVSDDAATITAYQGSGGDVTIPSELDGYPVTAIGEAAFMNKGLTSVTIPETVTSIGNVAFASNPDMTSVVIPKSVTSLGRQAFYRTGLVQVTVPGSIKAIEYGTFLLCSDLKTVVLEEGVESIDAEAFNSCGIESLTLPKGLKRIGGLCFNKNKMTEVTIPGSVTDLDMMAFISCEQLQKVTFEEGFTAVGSTAFASCKALKTIYFPSTLKSIAAMAFTGCSEIETVSYNGNAAGWAQVEIAEMAFDKEITPAFAVVTKKTNTLTAKGKTVTLRASTLKKKALTITKAKAFTISKAKGTVSFKLVSVTKSKFKKYFKVTSAGKITVKKGLKKGTYKVKVKVTAAGTAGYKSGYKNATVTVRVK